MAKQFTVSGNNVSGSHHATRGVDSIKVTGSASGTIHACKNGEDKTSKLIEPSSISAGTTYSILSTAPTGTYLIHVGGCSGVGATGGMTTTSNGTLYVGSGTGGTDDGDQ